MIEITNEYLASQGLSSTFPKRFWSKVHKTDGCWLWIGHVDLNGYGRIRTGIELERISAHRGSYIISKGCIPIGLMVLHDCPNADNKLCVNPDHLKVGTGKQNGLDASRKHQMPQGEQNHASKLTSAQVIEILLKHRKGDISCRKLGLNFGVTSDAIYKIINRIYWKHIDISGLD